MDQNSIRILEIKGTGSIAVSLDGLLQFNAVRLNLGRQTVHVFGTRNNEPNMVNVLHGTRKRTVRKLVNREIIRARGEVNIIRIRLPLDSHTQNGTIKIDRFANITDVERHMSKA